MELYNLHLSHTDIIYLITVSVQGYYFKLITVTDTYTHTHAVGLLWTRDQPVEENFIRQQPTFTRDRYLLPRGNSNPQSQTLSSRRPTPFTEITYLLIYVLT